MQRVFIKHVGNFDPGDCPERPGWWWEHYKEVSLPLPEVIAKGLAAIRTERQRPGGRKVNGRQ